MLSLGGCVAAGGVGEDGDLHHGGFVRGES